MPKERPYRRKGRSTWTMDLRDLQGGPRDHRLALVLATRLWALSFIKGLGGKQRSRS